MKIDADLYIAARRFVHSRYPIVYMGTPGCKPFAINTAHLQDPHLNFPSAETVVLRTENDAIKALSAIHAAAGDTDSELRRAAIKELEKSLKQVNCYCGKVMAALALRFQDCPFEEGQLVLQSYNNELDSLPGWEFNLLNDSTCGAAGLARVYRISRIHMRLIETGSFNVDGLDGVMEVRIVPSRNLRMVVETSHDGNFLTAGVEVSQSKDSWTLLFKTGEHRIDRGALNDYKVMEQALKESQLEPLRADQIIRKAAGRIGNGETRNYPVEELIESLSADLPPNRARRKAEILRRLSCNLERLYDAPVIAPVVRSVLDRELSSSQFLEIGQGLSVEAQAEFASLRMPLHKLEAAERFEGSVLVERG